MQRTGRILGVGNIKSIEIAVPLKYFSNFWKTFEIPSINSEINLDINLRKYCCYQWSTSSDISKKEMQNSTYPHQLSHIKIIKKLLQHLKSVFKLTGININQKFQHRHKTSI